MDVNRFISREKQIRAAEMVNNNICADDSPPQETRGVHPSLIKHNKNRSVDLERAIR